MARYLTFALSLLVTQPLFAQEPDSSSGPYRLRDLGFSTGILPAGRLNAITDVAGVQVGHHTLVVGDSVRTGVTAILPHSNNLYQQKVPAAVVVGNGYGKLMGSTQVEELGEIETPILLTNTLSVPRVADAVVTYMLGRPGNENVRSVNPVVAETNDGYLNDIRGRHVDPEHVFAAIESASDGAVKEGNVGAGTGTIAFGYKGGIGTSSRVLPGDLGGYTVGVLVQTNFGGVLQILGVPVGRLLGKYWLKGHVEDQSADGSIIVVVATDAPVSDRNLKRIGRRALAGLARTGSSFTNGSGDYVIVFSTHADVRRTPERRSSAWEVAELPNDGVSPLFQAVIESTEEAVYNALFAAEPMTGYQGRTVESLPVVLVLDLLRTYQRDTKP